jgi:hypothetical protein
VGVIAACRLAGKLSPSVNLALNPINCYGYISHYLCVHYHCRIISCIIPSWQNIVIQIENRNVIPWNGRQNYSLELYREVHGLSTAGKFYGFCGLNVRVYSRYDVRLRVCMRVIVPYILSRFQQNLILDAFINSCRMNVI